MPSNKRQSAPPPDAFPAPKATAKYTNKDGTKYISVPKSSASTPPIQSSPTNASAATEAAPAPPVNRKKQKRRAKAAAKAAAEQAEVAANGLPSPASTSSTQAPVSDNANKNHHPRHRHQHVDGSDESGNETESDEGHNHSYSPRRERLPTNGSESKSKKSKKKKKKGPDIVDEPSHEHPSGISKEKIWNTSGPEERERIKQFWLGLGEDERKSLVKVEKDAVLKKMKEQQKHTCSCSVCGRKRTAIEEELEGLYDAYYQELESFANQPHNHPHGPPMFGPKRFGPMNRLHPPGVLPPARYSNQPPTRGRIVEHLNREDELEDEEDEEEYSDEDGLEDEEDEDEPEEIPRDPYPHANNFFNFGQSLTVKGGILTVADDLLKNDGKKFIEMMEQLAERRMAREEDARDDHYPVGFGHTTNGSSYAPHNHPPAEEEEYEDEEEDEEEYDSQEDEYEDEEDTMTEEQRMEEGRRMFQIFAARMFEQRVLTAYREKVANERQEKLLEELIQEETQEAQRKAKKAKEAQKRKDKAAQKKQALLEDKAKREAAKAADDAARLAAETKRAEEAKLKAEEKRRKKDAQKKAEDEERQRKEAERVRRIQEVKDRQAELERKAREVKEREKKLKEEQRRKEQEARELKERETRERREKHEKDKRDKELRAAQAKADRDAKDKQKHEEKATQKAAVLAAPIPTQPAKKHVPALPQQHTVSHASPQITVATPALPKAPTPMKPRSVSQEVARSASQASHAASVTSHTASPYGASPPHMSPGPVRPPSKTSSSTGPTGAGPPTHPVSPPHAALKSPPGLPQFDMGIPPMGMHFNPPSIPPMGPGFGRMQEQGFPPVPGNFRPGQVPIPPPGLGGPMGGRPFAIPPVPPGFPQPFEHQPLSGMTPFSPPDNAPVHPQPHSRQASLSLDRNGHEIPLSGSAHQPISRPGPIARPGSTVQGQSSQALSAHIDDVSDHLGSSALLDDTEEVAPDVGLERQGTGRVAPGPASGPRHGFPSSPQSFRNPIFGSPLGSAWGAPSVFPPPPGLNPTWSPAAFAPVATQARPSLPRPVAVRQMLVRACKDLVNHAADADGYIELSAIKGHVDSINMTPSEPVSRSEILDMCDTEGNAQNGGGNFDVKRDSNDKTLIRFESGEDSYPAAYGAPGEIGSPTMKTDSKASKFPPR